MTFAKTLTRNAREAFRIWFLLAVVGYASMAVLVPFVALVPRFETSWSDALVIVFTVQTALLAFLGAALVLFIPFAALMEWATQRELDALNRQTAEHYHKTAKDALQ